MRGEKPDAMAWFGDLTYWYSAHSRIGDLPEAWQGERGIGQMHRDLGVGEYVPGSVAYNMREGEGVRHTVTEEGGILTTRWETPVGTLAERQKWSPESYSHGYVEHAVKSLEDLRVVRYIEEARVITPGPENMAKVERDYGEWGVPVAAVPGTPLTELNKHWIGVMDLAFMLADAPEEVEKTVGAMGEAQAEIWRITGEDAAPYVMICENLSAETMGGYFDRYIRDYLTMRMESLHAHGKQALIHIDGTLRGVVERIAATGVDAIDSVTPKPVGDVGMEEIRDLAGDEILLLGGLPGAMFAPPFTAEVMEAHVREIIRLHRDSGRFMFGVADQVPPNADLGLVRLVTELVEAEGRY
jgi:uroporphyrinogen-III decarboxylase